MPLSLAYDLVPGPVRRHRLQARPNSNFVQQMKTSQSSDYISYQFLCELRASAYFLPRPRLTKAPLHAAHYDPSVTVIAKPFKITVEIRQCQQRVPCIYLALIPKTIYPATG